MSINYTQEQVEMMKQSYIDNPSRETVEKLSETLDKSIKSIIGKLSREGVYKKTVYKTKTGESPITKKEIVQHIAELLEIDYGLVAGLEKAPKADLKLLFKTLEDCNDSWNEAGVRI